MEIKEELKEKYLNFISCKDHTENDIQAFLEEHSSLIPLPYLENHGLHFNAIISKFRLGNEYITDFAYLTKSSNAWNFVLIELESPNKRIFKECNNRYEFTSDFNSGLSQIRTWKQYVEENKDRVLNSISILKQPLSDNNLFFKYVLIYGRKSEIVNNARMRKVLSIHETEINVKIMTYDSLITNYSYMYGIFDEKIILSPVGDNKYRIKKIPNNCETSIFAYVSNEYLIFDDSIKDKLKDQKYQIDEWMNGEFLKLDNKIAESNSEEYINNKYKNIKTFGNMSIEK